ncbi:ribosome associated membrane protein RAMP4-domain-containing protein [Tribonema minus]|uniref:Ribosome associated membrane protein RAMP4-domain-containing protein n=1 Tax=Tribonema minus TaxID=303371 RepID=A0A835YYR5_9STRA|nr:ribosome associated membrane protein RAMP4-domain-containing protein [Tribonema minus]
MPTSRKTRLASEKYAANVTKRGVVSGRSKDKDGGSRLNPYVLAFIIFVMVGSTVFQIINMMQHGGAIFGNSQGREKPAKASKAKAKPQAKPQPKP